MYCDFAEISDVLFAHMIRSSVDNYKAFLEILFASYLTKDNKISFNRQDTSKYATRGRIPPAEIVEYYFLRNNTSIFIADINKYLELVLDKDSLQGTLFKLLIKDNLLSVAYRKRVAIHFSPQYRNDDELANLIFECVRISLERPYTKINDGKEYAVKSYFNPDLPMERDTMFSNCKFIPPCPQYCGYEDMVEELHSVIKADKNVFITGLPGIGKSELIRMYIQVYQAEYANIGYYIYNGSLRSIIANMNADSEVLSDTDEHERYKEYLRILRSLDEKTLIVIDNFNVGIEDDECVNDLLNLKCRIVFTSHRNYDGVVRFIVKGYAVQDGLRLIKQYYDYAPEEERWLAGIIHGTARIPLLIEMTAKLLQKGAYTAEYLDSQYLAGYIRDIEQSVTITKDGQLMKGSYFGLISKLFGLHDLSEQHRNVLCMMMCATRDFVKKTTAAKLFGLKNTTVIDELVDAGLITGSRQGTVMMTNLISTIVWSDLRPDKDKCRALIDNIRAAANNEILLDGFGDIREMVHTFAESSTIQPENEAFDFSHDAFKCLWRMHDSDRMEALNQSLGLLGLFRKFTFSQQQNAILDLERAAVESENGDFDNAVEYQKKALDVIMSLDDDRLKAEATGNYAYYLFESRIKDNVPTAHDYYKKSIDLYEQLDLDEGGQLDKCKVIARYAYMLLMTDHTDDALAVATRAIKVIHELHIADCETYADALYVLGLCHILKKEDKFAKIELGRAFHIYLRRYMRESDFIESKLDWVFNFALDVDSDIMETTPLKYLFEDEDDYDDDDLDDGDDLFDDDEVFLLNPDAFTDDNEEDDDTNKAESSDKIE